MHAITLACPHGNSLQPADEGDVVEDRKTGVSPRKWTHRVRSTSLSQESAKAGKRSFDEFALPNRVDPVEQVKKGRLDAEGPFDSALAVAGQQPCRLQ